MKISRFFIPMFAFVLLNACAPVGDSPDSIYTNDELAGKAGIDLSTPSEEEEQAHMIASRLEHQISEELRKNGAIGAEACRSGLRLPDAPTNKVIALTFDDGPNPATTNKILDILKARGVKATFFVLGAKARANPAILQRMVSEGHLVASHSQTHKHFGTINSVQTDYEIRTPHEFLTPYVTSRFFRYPYGSSTCQGNDLLDALKYQPAVGWHIDTCDWAMADGKFSQSEAQVCYGKAGPVNYLRHVMEKINESGGGVALFHDIQSVTANNLSQLIGNLVSANYKFIRVDNATYFPNLNKGLAKQKTTKVKQPETESVTEPETIPVVPTPEITPAPAPVPKNKYEPKILPPSSFDKRQIPRVDRW